MIQTFILSALFLFIITRIAYHTGVRSGMMKQKEYDVNKNIHLDM